MTTPQTHPDDDPATHERSGADVAEAVRVAEQGTAVSQVHGLPDEPGSAPVEQAAGDPAMTGAAGETDDTGSSPGNPDPARAGSGGAQSIVGARASDRVAAGEDLPDSPAY